ncbi:MAG TPA: hypothetical protein VGD54_18155 [Steroidobacteraceae bacterium]
MLDAVIVKYGSLRAESRLAMRGIPRQILYDIEQAAHQDEA